jgi:hypothetical protein
MLSGRKNMGTLRAWFIEEIQENDDDPIGHRQTVMHFDSTSGDWIRPDDRLDGTFATDRWDAVVAALSDINGKDRSWIMNPVALMDYCNNAAASRLRRRTGTGNDRVDPNE